MIIAIMKNDSSYLWGYLVGLSKINSRKTKTDLIDKIRNNKFIMKDLRNILKEILVQMFIYKGIYLDLAKIKNKINDYLLMKEMLK